MNPYHSTQFQVCLAGGLEVNECQGEDHGCWAQGNTTACVDTFRGYLCVCPEGKLQAFHMLPCSSCLQLMSLLSCSACADSLCCAVWS